MLVDYHNHTILCRHASGSMDDYLRRATEAGLREFGFAEHSFWMAGQTDHIRLCPLEEEMPVYFNWMDERRSYYDGTNGRPILRAGIEADWIPERVDASKKFLATYAFDYVIGSVHHVRHPSTREWILSWDFGTFERSEQIDLYFQGIGQLARSGLCDIIGHLDVIRRGTPITVEELLVHVDRVLPDLVAGNIAVEINTSGYDHGVGSAFPCPQIVKRLVGAGVPMTLGSDSHNPHSVGRHFGRAVEMLKDAGATEIVRFEGRRRYPVRLNGVP